MVPYQYFYFILSILCVLFGRVGTVCTKMLILDKAKEPHKGTEAKDNQQKKEAKEEADTKQLKKVVLVLTKLQKKYSQLGPVEQEKVNQIITRWTGVLVLLLSSVQAVSPV